MATSDCNYIQELLPLYIDNMLSEEETDIVCEHINTCASCKEEHAFLKAMTVSLGEIPEVALPEGFHARLFDKLCKEATKTKKAKRISLLHSATFRRTLTSVAAAAAVVAVSVVAHVGLSTQESGVNPDQFVAPGMTFTEQQDALLVEAPAIETPAAETQKPAGTKVTKKDAKKTEKADNAPATASQVASQDASQDATENATQVASQEATQVAPDGSAFAQSEAVPFAILEGESADGESAGVYARKTVHHTFLVTVDASQRAHAEELLSAYAQDETGYRVEDGTDEVLDALGALTGFSMQAETSDKDADYIVLK